MKILVTVLVFTALIADVAPANADQEGSPEAPNYALSLRMAAPAIYESTYGDIPAAPSLARRPDDVSRSVRTR